jgi:hypothetical protein
VRYDR